MLINNKKFLELLYDAKNGGATFTYSVKEPFKDKETGRSSYKEVTHPEDGCYTGRLSIETIRPTETNGLSEVTKFVKLFTHPEITIPAGSKITVTQNNVTETYKQSGDPAKYDSHQEIPVELWRVKA